MAETDHTDMIDCQFTGSRLVSQRFRGSTFQLSNMGRHFPWSMDMGSAPKRPSSG
jgi:hypothetical protein